MMCWVIGILSSRFYAWVSGVTYIRTSEVTLYRAVEVDFPSRRIFRQSMQRTMHHDLTIRALLF